MIKECGCNEMRICPTCRPEEFFTKPATVMVGGLVTMTCKYGTSVAETFRYMQCQPGDADYWVAFGGKAEAFKALADIECLAVCKDAFLALTQRNVYVVTAPHNKHDAAAWKRWAAKWGKRMV